MFNMRAIVLGFVAMLLFCGAAVSQPFGYAVGPSGGCVVVTGSGGCVGQTSPTLITPVLGVSTGTSLALAGTLSGMTGLTMTSGNVTLGSGDAVHWTNRTAVYSPADGVLQFSNNASSISTYFSFPVSGSLQLGLADVDTAPVTQTLRSQGALAGGTSNVAGANWTFIASPGKGSGAGGSFIFQTTPAGSSGTVVGTPTTALTLDSTQKATFGGQVVVASMTQTSAAQSGTVCFAAAGLTYDASLGCLASLEELKNIRPGGMPEALADIRKLKPFWFNWKSTTPEWKGGNHETLPGMGAHATEAVDKRLVGYGPDGKLRGVHYPEMVALLVAGMQQQQKQIYSLTRRVAVLEHRR